MRSFIQKIFGKTSHSLRSDANGGLTIDAQRLIDQALSRDGYIREQAVRQLIASNDPYAIEALIKRQNDYVPVVRDLALKGLLRKLGEIKDNEHGIAFLFGLMAEFAKLQHQSRSQYLVIFRKLATIFLAEQQLPLTYRYLKHSQGKNVRALYDVLIYSQQLSHAQQFDIALQAQDIGINLKIWQAVLALPLQQRIDLLAPEQGKLPIHNRMFHFRLLMQLITNESVDVWLPLAQAYLPYATVSQILTLLYYLKKQGFNLIDYSESLIKQQGEAKSIPIIQRLIQKSENTEALTYLLDHYPHWVNQSPSSWLALSLLIDHESSISQKMLHAYPTQAPARIYLQPFFKRWSVGSLEQYNQFSREWQLNNQEYLRYVRYLPTWEQLLALVVFVKSHNEDEIAAESVSFSQALTALEGKLNNPELYYVSLKDEQKRMIKTMLAHERFRFLFNPILPQLHFFKLMD
jgi:hypothetical protein